MATPPLPKPLREFLLEQQEPFTLQLYLLESGSSPNSCNFFKGTKLFQFVKGMLGKLALVDYTIKYHKIKKIKDVEIQYYTESRDKFSSLSSVNSCSDSDAEGINPALHEKQVVADRNVIFKCVEDSKQLSPVSVLEETESYEDDGFDGNGEVPQYLPKSLHSKLEEINNLPLVYTKNMKARQETDERTLNSDKVWKLMCHQSIILWGQDDSMDEKFNINHILISDLMMSAKKWRGVDEVQGKEIGVMICGMILEDICCDIVRDMISFGA